MRKKVDGGSRAPSSLILKMLNSYRVTCSLDLYQALRHETLGLTLDHVSVISVLKRTVRTKPIENDKKLLIDDYDESIDQDLARNPETNQSNSPSWAKSS